MQRVRAQSKETRGLWGEGIGCRRTAGSAVVFPLRCLKGTEMARSGRKPAAERKRRHLVLSTRPQPAAAIRSPFWPPRLRLGAVCPHLVQSHLQHLSKMLLQPGFL